MGPLRLWTPVVLAPMAGVTDAPFRRLCRIMGESGLPGALRPAGLPAWAADASPGADVSSQMDPEAGRRDAWRSPALTPPPDCT